MEWTKYAFHKRGGGGREAAAPPFVNVAADAATHILLIFHFLCFSFINIHFISFGLSLFYFILLFIYVSISFLYLIFHLWDFGLYFLFTFVHFSCIFYAKKVISNIGTKFLFPEWNAHNSTHNASYATIFSQNCCKWSKLSF